jgi:hypothetical protein
MQQCDRYPEGQKVDQSNYAELRMAPHPGLFDGWHEGLPSASRNAKQAFRDVGSRLKMATNTVGVTVLGSELVNIERLEDGSRVIADFKGKFEGGGNTGLQLVEMKEDGKWAVKKFIKPSDRLDASLQLFQTLHHPNICNSIHGYYGGLTYCLYAEVCEITDLGYMITPDDKDNKGKFPGHFGGT